MYGLPHDINLAFFSGKTLLQVCIGAHDLILNFDDDVCVTVTSSVACMDSSNTMRRYDDFGAGASTLAALLNQTVVSAQGDEVGTLTLRFNNGGMLAVYDDSKEYESYTIKNGEHLIIV
jgi:hypothetical protein